MNKLVTAILLALFGMHANLDSAATDAASNVAYASLQKAASPAPAPKPKPDPGAPKALPAACKCTDCKCENCPTDCTPAEWKWFPEAGELRQMKGATVIETRKYKKVAVMSCSGRRCVVTGYKWVPVE